MANIECASLTLRSNDLAIGSTNSVGIANSTNTSLTFTNIDLRTVLGDMYYNYDLFNLCLNTVSTGSVASTYTGGGYANGVYDNLCSFITMSGLPWKNQSYNQSNNHNNNIVTIGTFQFPSVINTAASQNYNNPKFVTFSKTQDAVNLSIQFNRIVDNTVCYSNAGSPFPPTIFLFTIYGIPKDDVNENGSRIIM
jgi:hypothetical protein